MDVNELAHQLLIARINAYVAANAGQNPRAYVGEQVIGEWHNQCLGVAKAIIQAGDTPLPTATVHTPEQG